MYWSFFLGFFILGDSTFAQQGSNHCGIYSEQQPRVSVCGGRPLPSDKVRNLRNLRLDCSPAADRYLRKSQRFDYATWFDLKTPDERQDFRQKEKPIQWTVTIPYPTTESWEWTECTYGADPVCGYHTETYTVEVDVYETVQENGKQVQRKTGTRTETRTREVMNECFHDEERSESRFCSTENMVVSSAFIRPSKKDWNPKSPGYYDVIPNKYDLLPGEIEAVQISTNHSSDTTLKPQVSVGNAWNNYTFGLRFERSQTDAETCTFGYTQKLNVNIYTQGRIYGRKAPNALRAESPEKALEWETAIAESNAYERYRPIKIKLQDASHDVIRAMSELSREAENERELMEYNLDLGQTSTASEDDQNRKLAHRHGFLKDTRIRVRLIQKTWALSRNIRPVTRILTSAAESADGSFYEIQLTPPDREKNLYRASGPISDKLWNWFDVELKPGRSYVFKVSMLQKGVPFYLQPKDDEDESAFSDEIEIPFKIRADQEQRNWFQKFLDFQGGD